MYLCTYTGIYLRLLCGPGSHLYNFNYLKYWIIKKKVNKKQTNSELMMKKLYIHYNISFKSRHKIKTTHISTIDQIKSLTATIIYNLNKKNTSKLFSRVRKVP